MEENIDVRISNYLTILGNGELRKNIDPAVVRNMEDAVAYYAAVTSKKIAEEYRKQQQAEESREKANSLFR